MLAKEMSSPFSQAVQYLFSETFFLWSVVFYLGTLPNIKMYINIHVPVKYRKN